jgi:hypothetical protein
VTGTSREETPIVVLWRGGRLPIEDGLYLASGASYSVELDSGAPGGIRIGDEFDLAELLAEDPDWLTTIDVIGEAGLPGHAGRLCRGEGSHGSEGFVARLGQDRELVWVLYFQESNPFAEIAVSGSRATFTSTSGIAVTVDLDHPEVPLG